MRILLLRYLLVLSLFFPVTYAAGQCGITVNAGPDAAFCPGSSFVQLNANISGPNLSSFSWSPTTGLDDPNSLTPRATVSGPITYTLTAEVFDPATNLIVNGDFEAGDSGFTTDYDPGSGGFFGLLSDEGEYAISTNSRFTHTNFASCNDHTGGGNMMVVNGSSSANDNIWCQSVTVIPNTTYSFNAWLQGVLSQNPARLQFSVNGVLLGDDFRASSTACAWNQFSERWMSGAATSAEICITNQNTGSSGNDFAIDDLFFGQVCTQTDAVNLTEAVVAARAVSPVDLPCDPASGDFRLDGTGSSEGPLYFYEWTTQDGNIVSDANTLSPSVNTPGTYTLTTRYDDGVRQCTDQVDVLVRPSSNVPAAAADLQAGASAVSCRNGTTTLTAAGSSTGTNIEYEWTTDDGNIVSGRFTDLATVDRGGTYELVVTNSTEGCFAVAFVVVTADTTRPAPIIQPPLPLTCNLTSQRLAGSNTTTGGNFTPSWTTTNGNIVSNADGFTPLIDAPGSYTLTVFDEDNGCSDSVTVIVPDGRPDLVISLQDPPPLSCANSQLRINATGTTAGSDIRYAWTTTDGNIVSNANGQMPLVDAPGTYALLLTDRNSGCTQRDSVIVVSGGDQPSITLQRPQLFTCDRAQIVLNATGTTDTNVVYNWASTDGTIVGGGDGLAPTVSGPGSYSFSVRDTSTGCQQDTLFTIGSNFTAPLTDAGTGFILDCGKLTDTLDGSASAQGPDLSYDWTTTNGLIVADTSSPRLVIGSPGTYTLRVTDAENGCSDTSSVVIQRDANAPDFAILSATGLTCNNPLSVLNTTSTGGPAGLIFAWTTDDGHFSGPVDGTAATVDSAGTYLLTVTNPANGCSQISSMEVAGDLARPVLDLNTTATLIDCNVPRNELEGLAPGATDVSFAWTTISGTPLTDTSGALATATGAGLYRLRVRRTASGCFSDTTLMITENTTLPEVVIARPQPIDCNFRQRTISAETGTNFSYAWSTDNGSIVGSTNGNLLDVDGAGTYQLVITDQINGCQDSAAVTTRLDTLMPSAMIAPPGLLTCTDDVLTLDGSASDEDLEFSWTWGTDDGNFVGLVTDLTPEIDRAGTYFITVSNLITGCQSSDTVKVVADQTVPAANAGPAELTLTCTDTTAVLGGDAGAMNGLTYRWTALEGIAPGTPNAPGATVQTAGIYELLVSNDANGCAAADTITVIADQAIPDAFIGPTGDLNCTFSERTLLAASGPPDQAISYRWTTTDGNITGGQEAVSVVIDRAGTYQLNALNPRNDCQDSTSLTIGQDTLTPSINLTQPPPLTCRNPVITLSTNLTNTGTDFSASWFTEDGSIVSGSNTPRPVINAAGTYALTVINRGNNCSATTNILVARNDTPPVLSASVPDVLNCRDLTTQLNVVNATFGENFRIDWATADGNLTAGSNTLTPTADQPGTYALVVIDEDTDCRSSIVVAVSQDITPPTVATGPGFDLGCEVNPVLLNAGARASGLLGYDWTTADGTILEGQDLDRPTVQGAGTYAIRVTDQLNFCTDSAEITLIQNLLLGFDTEETTPSCLAPFGSILVTDISGGTSPFLYSTNDGDNFSAVALADSLAPGRYDLVVQDANGCEQAATVLIPNAPELDLFVDPRVVVELGDNYFINTRSNFADTSLISINWTPAIGLDCSDCFRPTATPTETTTYTISVVSSDGCTATDSLQLVVDDLLQVYFPTGFSPNGDGINDLFAPAANPAIISSIQEFTVYDRWGEAVHQATNFLPNDPASGWNGQLNGRPLNPAVFVYTATVAFVDGRVVRFKGEVVLMK